MTKRIVGLVIAAAFIASAATAQTPRQKVIARRQAIVERIQDVRAAQQEWEEVIDYARKKVAKLEAREARLREALEGVREAVAAIDDQPTSLTDAVDIPTTLTASLGGIQLDWDESPESDLAEYRIYRDGALIGASESSAYSDLGLRAGTSHSYAVTAVDFSGNESGRSNTATATAPRRQGYARDE